MSESGSDPAIATAREMNRREWLRLLLGTAALGGAVSPANAIAALRRDVATGSDAREPGGRRLVLIELAGANDGLNTIVPWRDDRYHALRPTLGLRGDAVIDVGAELAFNAALAPLLPAFEAGELAVVQGLGYPRPNRSHFASIGLWESGGDGERGAGDRGWLTHDIEHGLARTVEHAHGISLDGTMQLFASPTGRWLSARSVEQLKALALPVGAIDALQGAHFPDASIADIADRMRNLDDVLARLHARLADAPSLAEDEEGDRGGELGAQLHEVARCIAAGLDTPVYRVRLDGFDTHEHQLGRHADRLRELGRGIAAFRRSLTRLGEWHETLVMTYSEFGRRAAQNESGGTDHGTAAPHLLIGGAIERANAGGAHGRAPDLGALVDGDPVATLDYRALYDGVLARWFGIDRNRFSGYRATDGALSRLFATA